jgi:hypothetical protein
MNCLECRELIQRMMDGDFSPEDQSALAAHATSCHDCRELQAAARRLLEGLRLATRPEPPPGLDQRICKAALLQSQRQFRTRRVAWAAAMAAGILAVLSLGYFWKFSLGKPQPSALAIRPDPPEMPKPAPSLNHSVEEAGKAVVALTRRAADETVDQTRMLLPQVLPEMPATGIPEIEPLLEQPSKSLREIQSGMTTALEPVTSSARRAMDLFLRELQPRERSNKRGS